MPYIVTVTAPAEPRWTGEVEYMPVNPIVSRRAVATLDEARDQARLFIDDAWRATGESWDNRWDAWASLHVDELPEPGGTIGPLPDGTTINVEQTTREALIEALLAREDVLSSHDWPWTTDRLCAAFNAAQEAKASA